MKVKKMKVGIESENENDFNDDYDLLLNSVLISECLSSHVLKPYDCIISKHF
jgi:hypothetical protein